MCRSSPLSCRYHACLCPSKLPLTFNTPCLIIPQSQQRVPDKHVLRLLSARILSISAHAHATMNGARTDS